MPVLFRVARVEELPPGASVSVRIRGLPLLVENREGTIRAVAAKAPDTSYRTQVRGGFVFVALDADREHAPAEIQRNALAPEAVES